MKYFILILATIILTSSMGYSKVVTSKHKETQPHRISIGPDLFVVHVHDVKDSLNNVYYGLKLEYDYLQPDAFYLGMDGLAAFGKLFIGHKSFSNTSLFTNLDLRSGYTFQSPICDKSSIAPFVGIGGYYCRAQYDNPSFSDICFYGSTGLRAIQRFSEFFDVGFNLKALYFFAGAYRVEGEKRRIDNNSWGYEIALPLTWHNEVKGCDFQLQPYLLKLDMFERPVILGARLQTGFNF